MKTKPHTTYDKFSLFFKDYVPTFINQRIEGLALLGYKIVRVEARSTKNADCHMITLVWECSIVEDEKTRNKVVLQSTSALLPHSGDIKLFWHKPNDVTQTIEATVLIWS